MVIIRFLPKIDQKWPILMVPEVIEGHLGCKPFQEKKIGIEIFCSSDSVFSPDSEYGFEKF